MRTKIISAFPGTGKSYYHNKYPDITLDSDSSNFSWVKDQNGNNTKERNPEFPQNYINHIKENIGKYKYIFVSSHKEVRDALLDNCIFFYIVYPSDSRKEEFIKRYRDRGNAEGFIKLVDENWENWMREIYWMNGGCQKIRMVLDNLEDELNHLEGAEYGEVLDSK
jgi:deoxyribodipyrimidine photolyase-like uncharacterized protein